MKDSQGGIDATAVAEDDAKREFRAALLPADGPEILGRESEGHRVRFERAGTDEDGVAFRADFDEAAFVAWRGKIGRRAAARGDASVPGEGKVCGDKRTR